MAFTFNSPETTPRLRAVLARLDDLVDWERWERTRGSVARMRVTVEPMGDLVRRLGRPDRDFRHVHVAGTKGKGSVSALIAAGLKRAGYRTGVYASPHIERVNERVCLDGVPIADEALAEALEVALDARQEALEANTPGAEATWFDVLTAAALVAFRSARAEWVVLECGLGGRLDSTNVIDAGPCVVTNIGLEHTVLLGDTRAKIAAEKAGILKPGGFVVSGVGEIGDEAGDVVREAARSHGIDCIDVSASPEGGIEENNVALAGALLDELGRRGLACRDFEGEPLGAWLLDEGTVQAARLPGRFERSRLGETPVILDGAHVPESLERVLDECEGAPGLQGRPTVVLGMGKEKDADRLLKMLVGRVDRVLCTKAGQGPYRTPEELLERALRFGLTAEACSPESVLSRARDLAGSNGWILVTGSLHLVGALRPRLRDALPPCSPSSPT